MPINRQGAFCTEARNLCEEFAPRNGAARVCGEEGANRALKHPAGGPRIPKFPARGSRPETENKGFAGSRARTMPAGGPPNPKHPAGRRASNPEIPGREPCRPPGPLCLPEDLQVCPPGPSHFRRTRSGRPPSPLCFPAGRAPTKKHRAAARCLLLSY